MYILCDFHLRYALQSRERNSSNRILSTLTNDIENVISNLIYLLLQEW